MHYKLYSTEDFIQDDFFQQWVFVPNEESIRYWTTFLLHYPTQKEKMDEAREFLLAMRFERAVPDSIVQEMRDNINTAVDEFELMQAQRTNTGKLSLEPAIRSARISKLFPLAASLLLMGVLIGYLAIQKDLPVRLLHKLTFEEQKTPQGEQRHFVLADGSRVWLNADSRILYPQNFSGRNIREVYLEGEAFFDVAKDEKPFVVNTSELAIKVLGTAFNVKSYAKDRVVETTLVRGKVSIASVAEETLREVTLLPNQQALFSRDSRTLDLEDTVNTENYIAWKNGWMIFDDKPFSFIKETMERWYGVTIQMEDENSLSCTYSARFRDKTLQEVLEIFRNTEAINYRIDGKQVFISGKLCQYEP